MGPGLTENDMNRIKEYLETPVYERDPEQLLPVAATGAEDGQA